MHREAIFPPGTERSSRRFGFAPAVLVGNTVYVSGVIGRGPDGSVPVATADEFHAAFRQLGAVLTAAGVGFADVVELTTFHLDLPATIAGFLEVKACYVGDPLPAWTAIGISALAVPGARVEIKATAVVPGQP